MVVILVSAITITVGVGVAIHRRIRHRQRQRRLQLLDDLQQQQRRLPAGSKPGPLGQQQRRRYLQLLRRRRADGMHGRGSSHRGGGRAWVAGDAAEPRRGGLALPRGALPEADTVLPGVLNDDQVVDRDADESDSDYEDCDEAVEGDATAATTPATRGEKRWFRIRHAREARMPHQQPPHNRSTDLPTVPPRPASPAWLKLEPLPLLRDPPAAAVAGPVVHPVVREVLESPAPTE
ncbi:hypothetical protein HK405_010104, partial [Cladochytrium tenue]